MDLETSLKCLPKDESGRGLLWNGGSGKEQDGEVGKRG